MTAAVLDASAAIKWFLPEVHSAEARAWRTIPDEWHTLAFFFDLEIANVLWKKLLRSEIDRTIADDIMSRLPELPVIRHSEAPLLGAAFVMAHDTRRNVYDSLYLALAVSLGAELVTADQKLANGVSGTPWGKHVRWVGDLPAGA